ncbi:cbb3-type cytochrome c oxidase subunit I [Paraconexibacter antarcticus]|uniref:Cbb3-type cytochrome c oxidase subunit I n=1 Tax=Paraconexibacter antarcticus TaxID=2949664 RepID=A0ABY5DV15_9ACTN|nr:cbb3-type cytochrome c oxidase subunit I [Paraconexibacter antarcticus]UTI65335.1 cbb3-type cytochrome c oxidase subunit I [Paraconexibacter antarcticus]
MSSVIPPPPPAATPLPVPDGPSVLSATVASTDHKAIARGIGRVAAVFFLVSGVFALLMRAELAQPGRQVVSEGTYAELFTMHGSGMIYLVVTPVALALGVYLVPLQVGARRIAAPRAALAGAWLYAAGGVVMFSGFLTSQGAGRATWTGIDPLSDAVRTPGAGMDVWVLGVAIATFGELLLAGCVLATALRLRTAGMTLLRMPPLTWTLVVTCLMAVFAFPVLIVTMGLLWLERHGVSIFRGGDGAIAYQHLFWFYGHPVVYVMFFPFVGAVAEVLTTASGRPLRYYPLFVGSLLLFTALSMSVWAHHMFTTGAVDVRYFALTSTALVVPAGLEYLELVGALWSRTLRLGLPVWFAIAFLVQFLVGGLSGVWVASPALDNHANNSYIVVAHFHYTLFGGSLFGLFAGLYHWWPKVTGRLLGHRLGVVHLVLGVVGTNLTFLPMFFAGEHGMTRRVSDYPQRVATPNLLSSIGAAVLALSMAALALNLWRSARHGRPAPPDPWGGLTLEWATPSPPPRGNFVGAVPVVRSVAPLAPAAEEGR